VSGIVELYLKLYVSYNTENIEKISLKKLENLEK